MSVSFDVFSERRGNDYVSILNNSMLDWLQPTEGTIPTLYFDHLYFTSSHLYPIKHIEL